MGMGESTSGKTFFQTWLHFSSSVPFCLWPQQHANQWTCSLSRIALAHDDLLFAPCRRESAHQQDHSYLQTDCSQVISEKQEDSMSSAQPYHLQSHRLLYCGHP